MVSPQAKNDRVSRSAAVQAVSVVSSTLLRNLKELAAVQAVNVISLTLLHNLKSSFSCFCASSFYNTINEFSLVATIIVGTSLRAGICAPKDRYTQASSRAGMAAI